MNRFLFLIFLLFSNACFAQDSKNEARSFYEKEMAVCGGEDSIFSRKGKWKRQGEDNLVFPDKTFPKSQYKFSFVRLDSILAMLKNSILDLSGMEPRWKRSIREESYIPDGPTPYYISNLFFTYYCNTNVNKILLGDETFNWVYVFVNKMNWFFHDVDKWIINDDGKPRTIYQLPPKAGKWKGMTVYEPDFFNGTPAKVTHRTVVIGRNGKIPWRTLTQKEYLTGLKNDYETKVKKFKAGSGYEADYKNKLKYIHDYLSITDEETIQQPAIIDPKSGIWGFKGKFGDEEEGGYRLALFGGGTKYFDTTLPRYVPQLIQLMWIYNTNEPVALHFKNQFEENFPLEKLKAMIDK